MVNSLFYNDHFQLPVIGPDGVEQLQNSKVLVIGLGGLGCPAVGALAASAVGEIGLMDGDLVAESNLARQFIFSLDDIGKSKSIVTAKKLRSHYPDVRFTPHPEYLTQANASDLLAGYDLIIDATDNFKARNLIAKTSESLNKPEVYGAIFQSEGQLTLLNHPSNRCTFSEIFSGIKDDTASPACSISGTYVIASMSMGLLMANEAVKCLLDMDDLLLAGKLLMYDLFSLQQRIISIKTPEAETALRSQSVSQALDADTALPYPDFKAQSDNADCLLIDVRTLQEHQRFNIGGINVPIETLLTRKFHYKDLQKDIFIYCSSGIRSKQALLQIKQLGAAHVYQLQGGLSAAKAYRKELTS